MSDYKAPLRDIQFVLYELLDYENHCLGLPNGEEASRDLIEAVLQEGGKFCEQVLAPLNRVGDEQGCRWENGDVTTPEGFRAAYEHYVEAGWPSMNQGTEFGGQGLPESLGTVMSELLGEANWAWSMYPGLSHGAMKTLEKHGTAEQKSVYLSKLVEGRWTGTMCLTEAHCGTDLGLLKTRAEPQSDGSYKITGTKIFISAGEHDLAENIVHIVLARLPDAPEGTKGISLFIVPKYLPDADGNIAERNLVHCGSIEDKMGIHGNATCLLNFDGAKGFLVGPANRGLHCMFTFMNQARLGIAVQGLAHAELGYQKALAYALDRLQMRSLTGPKNPDGPADPIIVHPDVRRMLLTQKAFTEGSRMLLYYAAMLVDREKNAADNAEEAQHAADLLALLTPIAKAFVTEIGFESANLALQCFGGHGYIREWGVEQNVRDARIALLYEGTTGIQALDLLGRKVLMSQGEILKRFTKVIHKFCVSHAENKNLAEFIQPLSVLNTEWGELTLHVGMAAMENADEVGAAAVDYLMYSGYVSLAYFWARAADTALQQPNFEESDFYQAKLHTARFYFQKILPRTLGLSQTVKAGASCLMTMNDNQF